MCSTTGTAGLEPLQFPINVRKKHLAVEWGDIAIHHVVLNPFLRRMNLSDFAVMQPSALRNGGRLFRQNRAAMSQLLERQESLAPKPPSHDLDLDLVSIS
jgi:hypothetical protein